MRYEELTLKLAVGVNLTKQQVDSVLKAFVEMTTVALENGDSIALPGLIKLHTSIQKARTIKTNMVPSGILEVPDKTRVKMTVSPNLKRRINRT